MIVDHKINLFGKGESDIEAEAMDLTARGRIPEVGITAHEATISFRIRAEGADEVKARAAMGPTLALIRERFGLLIVGEGTDDVAEAVVAELPDGRHARHGRVVHRRPGRPHDHALPGVNPHYPGGVVRWPAAPRRREHPHASIASPRSPPRAERTHHHARARSRGGDG